MKVFKEMQPSDHDAWSGAIDTLKKIKELNLESDFDSLIEEMYHDGIDETQLNDILWFESEWIFESLGIKEEEEEEI